MSFEQCRSALLSCSEFDNHSRLHAIFITAELRPFRHRLPEANNKDARVNQVLAYLLDKQLTDGRYVLPIFLDILALRYDPAIDHYRVLTALAQETRSMLSAAENPQQANLFICYKRGVQPDHDIALTLHQALNAKGHEVFIDQTMRVGESWMAEIDKQIEKSDFLIVLLSASSAESEMVQAEIHRAFEYRRLNGKPQVFALRINYNGLLPYQIAAFLNRYNYLSWSTETNTDRLIDQLEAAISGQTGPSAPKFETAGKSVALLSEDGRPLEKEEHLSRPAVAFDPRYLKSLAVPGGVVRMRDKLYVVRDADYSLKREIVKQGSTITIRAPRQTGKTSLLVRGLQYAQEQKATTIHIDLQSLGREQLSSFAVFAREIAELIAEEAKLEFDVVENIWHENRSPQHNLRYFLENVVLPKNKNQPFVLALDEADILLKTVFYSDFFRLLRAWHNRRATRVDWKHFNMVLVIATEPYLLIDNIHESPFNVGLQLNLPDFDVDQMGWLNQEHGRPVAEGDFSDFTNLFNGQPFLTRKALYQMAVERISWPHMVNTADDDDGPFGDHLRRLLWGLKQNPELVLALKQVIREQQCDDDEARYRLLRVGLIQGSGNIYKWRCGLYEQYFSTKLL